MRLDKLRYQLTEHTEKLIFDFENYILLFHPNIENEIYYMIEDDIKLIPKIPKTRDNVDIKFYFSQYKEEIYYKSELLAFIYASINNNWDIIKGSLKMNKRTHFWLKKDDVIYDPALGIVVNENIYLTKFKQNIQIDNKDIFEYLKKHNNLNKFYKKTSLHEDKNFSVNFINDIVTEFNSNVENQYTISKKVIEETKKTISVDDFLVMRQLLTKQRKYFIKGNNIAIHPDIDKDILIQINEVAKLSKELMEKEYNIHNDYFFRTIGNCYGLSIMFNLFDENFKLVQGGIPSNGKKYQHSWLEKDNIIYDPAFRIITLKDLYYIFVEKEDEYTKEDTENILKRIGFNLTHFKDFIGGHAIGNCESIRYYASLKYIDTEELKQEGENLINNVKKYKMDKKIIDMY